MKVKKGYYLVGYVAKNKWFASFRFMNNSEMIPTEFYDEVKADICEETGQPSEDIVILAISKIA